jgi:hypothetical protein
VGEHGRVPNRQEADRRRRVRIGKRGARQVEQFLPVLGQEAAQSQPLERRRDLLRPQPGPVGDFGL